MIRLTPLACLVLLAAGQPGERRFDPGRFVAIDLTSSDHVRVVSGDAFAVTATGDPRAVASLAVELHGVTLRIGRTPGTHTDRGALVTVTTPGLDAATLSGSGAIDAPGMAGDAFTARLNGSGEIRLAGLHVREARLMLGGSGSLVADGSATHVTINLGGSGDVDAARLAATDLDIALGGSGAIVATATGAARIRAAGSGRVRVLGHPACSIDRAGSGHVTCG